MILCDREIKAALGAKSIYIFDPPSAEMYASTAVDLTLDKRVLVWAPKPPAPSDRQRICPNQEGFNIKQLMQDPQWARKEEIGPAGFEFGVKGQFILVYTRERISLPHTSRIAARVEGKSSLARLGIGVHVTAPTIHAGFGYNADEKPRKSAQPLQLEMFNLSGLPVVLEVGMRICQLILEEVREVPSRPYEGVFTEQPDFGRPNQPRRRGHG
jgi:dCTP deaminase